MSTYPSFRLVLWCTAALLTVLPAGAAHAEPPGQAPAEPAGEAPAEPEEQPAESAPQHCYGDGQAKWVFGESLVLLTNPLGAENVTRFGRCWPLITEPGLLFDYTNVEIGLYHALSPVYLQQGGYLSVAPLSLLVFRLEAAWAHQWPLPGMDGVGYFDRAGYEDSWPSDGIDSEGLEEVEAGFAKGVNLAASVTLQGSVSLAELSAGELELLLVNGTGFEYWLLGDEDYYYNSRKDVILARSDWLLTNSAALLLSIPFSDTGSVRIGGLDQLIYVPGADLVGTNQVGGLLAVHFARAGESLRGLQPFFLLTGYTHHTTRQLSLPLNFLLGIDLAMIVGPVPRQPPAQQTAQAR